MSHPDRREFFHDVGAGMLAVLVGPSVAAQLGFAADGDGADASKPSSALARLADLVQQTPTDRLLPALVEQLGKGVSPRDLVAAGAVANARAFGGQDYNGYHTFMALCPSFSMAMALPERERPLPILKVLYRNSQLTHGGGCEKKDLFAAVEPAKAEAATPERLRDAARARELKQAEAAYAGLKGDGLYDDIQLMVQDDLNVHRVVLAWRAWEVLDFTGKDHARAMLRQTVRFCSDARHSGRAHPIREALPKLLEAHKLLEKRPGSRAMDDAAVEKLARLIYADKQLTAADAVAAALAEGFSPDSVGEALAQASTMLVLGDPGRPKAWTSPGKPEGSVHGDSVGVHASDAANAWRHIASTTNARHSFASLIAAAYHTAGQAGRQMAKPWPLAEDVEKVEAKGAERLLSALDEAIKGGDQRRAAAVAARFGADGHDAKAILAALRAFAVSEDGALHAEKYFQTASEEFGRGRPSFRWKHVAALARVTASAYGRPAPGVVEARKLLKA